jgi:hypothetical protein
MTVALAIGAGILMTIIAVAIGGLALELLLLAISRSLAATEIGRAAETSTAVIRLKTSDNTTGTLDWAEEIAA